MAGHPLSPEFVLLRFGPSRGVRPTACCGAASWPGSCPAMPGQEIDNEQLRRAVNADLLPLLLREEGRQASLPGCRRPAAPPTTGRSRARAPRAVRRSSPTIRILASARRAPGTWRGSPPRARPRRTGRRCVRRSTPSCRESAPFSPEQRAWLNGFFAGLVSLDGAGVTALSPEQNAALMPRRRATATPAKRPGTIRPCRWPSA